MIAQRVLINVVETVAMNGLQYWRKKKSWNRRRGISNELCNIWLPLLKLKNVRLVIKQGWVNDILFLLNMDLLG